jgi:hypothetical protein
MTPEYQIDPLNEGINITITNFNSTQTDPVNITFPAEIKGVQLIKGGTRIPPDLTTTINGTTYDYKMYNDYDPTNNPTIDVKNDSVNLLITPAYLTTIKADQYSDISINFLFNRSNKLSNTFDYSTVASPSFIPGILEVKVW